MAGSRESERVRTRRVLTNASDHLRKAGLTLAEVNKVYSDPYPVIGEACQRCVELIAMVENLVWDIRNHI